MPEHIPTTGLRAPTNAPPAVAKANETYRRLVSEYKDTRAEVKDAKEAIGAAEQADRNAFADAAMSGDDTPDPAANVRAARLRLADLEAGRDALAHAVDRAGRELQAAINEARGDWIAEVTEQATAARSTYDKALDQIRDSLGELAEVFATSDWLQGRGIYADMTEDQRRNYRPARRGQVQLRPGEAPVRIDAILDSLANAFRVEAGS